MSDSEYEYEEETKYVAFDFGISSTDLVDRISRDKEGCRIIGLEEGSPYLQVGDLVFEGKIDETIGTHMVFEIKEKTHDTKGLLPLLTSMRTEEDAPKQNKYSLSYVGSTENVAKMESITLHSKNTKPPDSVDIGDDTENAFSGLNKE